MKIKTGLKVELGQTVSTIHSWKTPTSLLVSYLTFDLRKFIQLLIELCINIDSETESRRFPLLRNNPLTNLVSNSPLSTLASSLNWIDGTTCVSPNAEAGICSLARVCSNLGGRSSGSCPSFGTVCCISKNHSIFQIVRLWWTIFDSNLVHADTVTRCGGVVTLNNTYWQAPASVSSGTACSLTVRLDPTLPQQRRNPICQVRLVDLASNSIAFFASYVRTNYNMITWIV